MRSESGRRPGLSLRTSAGTARRFTSTSARSFTSNGPAGASTRNTRLPFEVAVRSPIGMSGASRMPFIHDVLKRVAVGEDVEREIRGGVCTS